MTQLLRMLLITFLFSNTTLADHNDDVHFAAHAGLSYAADTFLYGLYKKAFHADDTSSEVLAAATTLMIGVAYKVQEPGLLNLGRPMLQNSVGIGAAIGTHIMFNF